MKVIIAGSRSITNPETVAEAMREAGFPVALVVSGAARGVDTLGENWAKANNIPVVQFPAAWDTWGKSAGFIRNTQMAEYADALVAVWDGQSRGTAHMIGEMVRLKKPIFKWALTSSPESVKLRT